jgi:methanogenic corrinoid protein MtbC1
MQALQAALLDLDRDGVMTRVQQVIDDTVITPKEAVDTIAEALDVVGRRFQVGEWFLGELVYSGTIAREAMDQLAPLLAADETAKKLGKVVVGTIEGDMHDLGKSIFVNYARSAGFEVLDLGVDVPVSAFIEAAAEHRPLALGMCCLLTPAAGGVGSVVQELQARGMREQTRVILGGAAMTEEFARDIGADAYAADAVTGTDILRGWVG